MRNSYKIVAGTIVLGLLCSCGQQPADKTKAELPKGSELALPFTPIGEPTDRTRVLVEFPKAKPGFLYLKVEEPRYQMETVPQGQEGTVRAWAVGGELVIGGEIDVPKVMNLSTSYQYTQGKVVATFTNGGGLDEDRLKAWHFVSDPTFPLTFKVVKDRGLVYLCGHGSVQITPTDTKKLGDNDTPALWLERIKSSDPLQREGSVLAMGWKPEAQFVPALIEALKDTVPAVRRSAAESLGKTKDATAAAELKRLTDSDPDDWTKQMAKWAVGQIAGPPAKGD